MEHLSNDHKGHPNQHENSHKLCDEIGHPILRNICLKKKIEWNCWSLSYIFGSQDLTDNDNKNSNKYNDPNTR